MKTTIITSRFASFAVACFAIATLAGAAFAQETGSRYGAAIRYGDNGTPVIYHHASTLEEGVLRGTADLARGIGDMNYSNSLAAINIQEARARAIDNRKSYVQTYFDVKAINRQAQAQTRRPQITASDAARLARNVAPKGLSAGEFNTATGSLVWPSVLSEAEFAAEREAVNNLVASHGVEVREVKQIAAEMDVKLVEKVNDLPVSDYVAAKRFLRGLQADAAYGPSVASR
jgi:hypothetical protein